MLGGSGFAERHRDRIEAKRGTKEHPRVQRQIARPSLRDLLEGCSRDERAVLASRAKEAHTLRNCWAARPRRLGQRGRGSEGVLRCKICPISLKAMPSRLTLRHPRTSSLGPSMATDPQPCLDGARRGFTEVLDRASADTYPLHTALWLFKNVQGGRGPFRHLPGPTFGYRLRDREARSKGIDHCVHTLQALSWLPCLPAFGAGRIFCNICLRLGVYQVEHSKSPWTDPCAPPSIRFCLSYSKGVGTFASHRPGGGLNHAPRSRPGRSW